MDKLFHNGNQIGFIQINEKGNPVIFYKIKGLQVNRSEIGISSGMLFIREIIRDDYYYDYEVSQTSGVLLYDVVVSEI